MACARYQDTKELLGQRYVPPRLLCNVRYWDGLCYGPMRCPVLRIGMAIGLGTHYVMSGTEIAYDPTRYEVRGLGQQVAPPMLLRVLYALSGTAIGYGTACLDLRMRYAMCGTDVEYAAIVYAIVLCLCHAMSSTDTHTLRCYQNIKGKGALETYLIKDWYCSPSCYAMSGIMLRDVRYHAVRCPVSCYAMSGTDLAYAAIGL
eukprot:1330328-Rhodomonas_salina.2